MSDKSRYELKFILDEVQYTDILRWLNTTLPSRRSHPARIVNSLYIDDPEFSAVKDNLTGVADRFKIRLRWYTTNEGDSVPNLELKIRKGRLGFKRHISTEEFPTNICSIPVGRFTQLIQTYSEHNLDSLTIFNNHLCPSLYVNYCREYFESPINIRITIDSKINYVLPNPFQSLSDSISLKFPHRVMEIKFPPSEKNHVSRIIGRLHLTPKRHSKYLMGLSMHGQVNYI